MTHTVSQNTRLRLGYGLAALLILVAEVLIALFVRDRFIRPYGGDILVTLLICCAIRVILPKGYRLPIGGGVLLLAAVFLPDLFLKKKPKSESAPEAPEIKQEEDA